MFRRLPSGLPKDPVYPANLQDLGYIINPENDEIRNINNPKAYFKYFLTKNDRYNAVQREAMNECIRQEVLSRLLSLGLEQTLLPLADKHQEPKPTLFEQQSKPHLPILHSPNLSTASRVIILFYEQNQDLGIFAHRVIGGKGGINAGSAVEFVKYIQEQANFPLLNLASPKKEDKREAPAIILANMGQLRWWRRGKKPVTIVSWHALPQKSAVDQPYRFDEIKNSIPGNRTAAEHVAYMFNTVIARLVNKDAKIDVIGVSDGAVQVAQFLDNEKNFKKWIGRFGGVGRAKVEAFAAVSTYWQESDFKCAAFKEWFRKRGRTYLTSPDPPNTFLAGPHGNSKVSAFGSNAYSLGEPYYSELMLQKGFKYVIEWFKEAATVDYTAAKDAVARGLTLGADVTDVKDVKDMKDAKEVEGVNHVKNVKDANATGSNTGTAEVIAWYENEVFIRVEDEDSDEGEEFTWENEAKEVWEDVKDGSPKVKVEGEKAA